MDEALGTPARTAPLPRTRIAPTGGPATARRPRRAARATRRTRRYLMASPDHVAMEYAINPWMDADGAFDPERAIAQWGDLRRALRRLGHRVDVLPAAPGLPDLVFAANGAFVLGDRAFLSRFAHPERRGEETVHRGWHVRAGHRITQARAACEGEGDLLTVGDVVLAGTGFRTELAAHDELRAWTDREVVTLELVDERYYHLDTALGVVGDDLVVWHPPALSPEAAEEVERRYPDAIVVDEHDAALLGCNLLGDERTAIVPAGVDRLAHDLAARGRRVVAVDLSELRRLGGGPKCCVAELHPA